MTNEDFTIITCSAVFFAAFFIAVFTQYKAEISVSFYIIFHKFIHLFQWKIFDFPKFLSQIQSTESNWEFPYYIFLIHRSTIKIFMNFQFIGLISRFWQINRNWQIKNYQINQDLDGLKEKSKSSLLCNASTTEQCVIFQWKYLFIVAYNRGQRRRFIKLRIKIKLINKE